MLKEWIDWTNEYQEEIKWLLGEGFAIIKMDATDPHGDALIARKALSAAAGIEIVITYNDEQREFFEARVFVPQTAGGQALPAPKHGRTIAVLRARTKFVPFADFLADVRKELRDSKFFNLNFGHIEF